MGGSDPTAELELTRTTITLAPDALLLRLTCCFSRSTLGHLGLGLLGIAVGLDLLLGLLFEVPRSSDRKKLGGAVFPWAPFQNG